VLCGGVAEPPKGWQPREGPASEHGGKWPHAEPGLLRCSHLAERTQHHPWGRGTAGQGEGSRVDTRDGSGEVSEVKLSLVKEEGCFPQTSKYLVVFLVFSPTTQITN